MFKEVDVLSCVRWKCHQVLVLCSSFLVFLPSPMYFPPPFSDSGLEEPNEASREFTACPKIVESLNAFLTYVSDKLSSLRSLVRGSESQQIAASVSGSVQDKGSLWVSQISTSKLTNLSFVSRICAPEPNVDLLAPNPSCNRAPSVTSLSALLSVYQSAELAKASKPLAFTAGASLVVPEVSYPWHLPETNATEKSRLSHLQQHRMVNIWSHFGKVSEARFIIDGKG